MYHTKCSVHATEL